MKAGQNSDELLVRRFNEGDTTALKKIYDMYFTHLYYFAYRITQHAAEAEDIAVVTLEILLRRNTDFVTMNNIKAFLFITVRNKCLKYLDAVKRHRQSEQELSTLSDEKDDYVLAQMVRSEFLMEVYREIECLPPVRKNVFKLFYIDGLDSQAIARKLKMTPAAVYNNKLKALKQLRNVLIDKKLLPFIAGLFCIRKLFTD
ncbi:sigma-70 family RNA polymerase sigma factor [Niastella caeni]|uniref:Sigma-70 family RNA polymerase sigma factor n=1 Tax=Niastella caeni TaxID=2569763 RepID=A0A4S8HV24_9BACT|nr:sigma-70 family RNA polymerase sigma factor [Niastella caeni]THU39508.1 sigma-70 family RNA polymerase sigma factor [Niastella caeni]